MKRIDRQTQTPFRPPEGVRLRRARRVFRDGVHAGSRVHTAAIRPYVRLNENEYVVMPNHMHASVARLAVLIWQ